MKTAPHNNGLKKWAKQNNDGTFSKVSNQLLTNQLYNITYNGYFVRSSLYAHSSLSPSFSLFLSYNDDDENFSLNPAENKVFKLIELELVVRFFCLLPALFLSISFEIFFCLLLFKEIELYRMKKQSVLIIKSFAAACTTLSS